MEGRSILKNKLYLYLTEFFAGMSVMAVEMGASRLLAPYFSSSQIVYTIVIGTIMIAMALGNVWGGRSADRDPNPDRLYRRILVAAVWIAAIPLVGKYVILGVSGLLILTVSSNFLVLAAFIACMVIFVFPLFLLGTVTPSLAKYTVGSLEDSGKIVGTLGAFNTIGSIIGTFLPTFVTIPAVGTSITFLIFSGVLLLLGLVYFISKKEKRAGCVAAAVLFVLCSIFGNSDSFAFWESDLVYEGESIYNYLQVKEDEDSVILSTNVLFGVQSILKKDDSLTGMYYDYALAAPLMAGQQTSGQEVLILGMGTGTYATQCRRYYDGIFVEGVEIDQRITDLARQYFELPEEVSVTTYDGRAYLQAVDQKYDVIMVDAYQDITIPFQMSSVEFFTMVREHLKEDGVMVVNMNMQSGEEGSINEYLTDTISSVFDTVYTVNVLGSTNRELFASQNPQIAGLLTQNAALLSDPQLKNMMEHVAETLELCDKGDLILTDDKAPVELLGMRVIDGIIRDEIGYYKTIFKEKGISGLLNAM
ncbi:MAG: fused MFS/spermidine synthase [Eubacteriales bacterium]|nr:fused MFS/spermidine synthase [Eubacteriales bacterium]